MSEEQRRIDEAIASLRGFDVSPEDRAAIKARYGEATAHAVVAVYAEAMRPPDRWGEGDTMRNGLDAMHARLRDRYLWLGEWAHDALESMFRKVWR